MSKIALITGITGQDGSYLTEFLLKKGYEVHGIIRRASVFNTERIDHLIKNPKVSEKTFFFHYGDLTDSSNLNRLLQKIKPDEVYNLAAQSHVKVSFEVPEYTAETDAIGALRLLDAIRDTGVQTNFYQASTSELYGMATEPQNEETPFYPKSPYACAKLYAYWITVNYREAYSIFASNGILFNHESPRRGKRFVTRKITRAIANICLGTQDKLYLGNLNAKRDWGYAPEYVETMWLILNQNEPGNFVIATGETHTIREFVEEAFRYAGHDVEWNGKGIHEKGIGKKSGKVLVKVDPRYFRPTETDVLIGDASKAKKKFGWNPKIRFKDLVKIMVDADMRAIGLESIGEGDKIIKKKFPHRWWGID